MRILVAETVTHGGILHYAIQMADGLAERGHEVDFLVPRDNELAGHEGAARMLPVLTRPIRSIEQPGSKAAYFARRAEIATRLTAIWARIHFWALRGRYDVVLLPGDLSLPLNAVGAGALTLRERVAVVCHNVRPFNRWAGEELFTEAGGVLARVYPRFDVVFVHGERSRREFEETWPPSRLVVIPMGDEGLFAGEDPPPPADGEGILFFGDWRKVKGLPVLLEAFDRVAAERPEATLTIAGTPSPADFDPQVVRDWARKHDGRVTVRDEYVPIEDVRGLFAAARVVACPYLVGYQSAVSHLAMTMGRAVVATDVGDLPAAIGDGQAGRIVAPGDPQALASALCELLADREQAERLGAGGLERMRTRASWATVAEQVEAALAAS